MTCRVVYRVLLGVLIAACAAARAADPDDLQIKIATAVAHLASSDPADRDAAATTLIGLGAQARRAVFEASRSDDPELSARASELLLKLPWYLPDDSPAVRVLLQQYGQLDVDHRKQVVVRLSELPQHGFEAMERLIVEEPSDDVKWVVVAAVRTNFREAALAGFRKLDTTGDASAPLLAAAGHAWMSKDARKGAALLRQSLVIDAQHPAGDGGEVEIAYERLQNLALLAGEYDRVAELLRMRAARNAVDGDGEPSRAVLELFAAHAKFGPLNGFDKDLETYKDQLGDARLMFAIGKIYERAGQPLLAAATYRSAHLADLVSVQDRFDQGDFLLRQGWLDLAEGEFSTIFDVAADHSTDPGRRKPANRPGVQFTAELDQANAHFRLAQVAAAREDDYVAAEHMRQAMELHYKGHGELTGASDTEMWQDINWHYLRAAVAKGDKADVDRRLGELLASASSTAAPLANPDVANDVVPLLRARGRVEEASDLYKRMRQGLQDNWPGTPEHPMLKNNLAWLSARCGEQKEEALRLALEASEAMPDNAAFVDTLAEAHYQLGHYGQAARLEAKVVGARPNDRFLRNQLKRFEEAAKGRERK
ncbi:MAG TPA: hypothetical protein VH475_21730 [Tepidisphaeraceae bacterium]